MWALPELIEAAARTADTGIAGDALARLASSAQLPQPVIRSMSTHVLSCALHRSLTFRLGAPAGAGAVFQGLDRAEKVAEADFVALGIRRIEQPLVDRYADGLLFRLAGLGLGQLCTDVKLEFVQEGVIASRDAHLFSIGDVLLPGRGSAQPVAVADLAENRVGARQQVRSPSSVPT
jgi:hypothetical protein